MWAKARKNGKLIELESCVKCGLDDLKHFGRGLCTSCYWYEYNRRPERAKKMKESHRKYHLKHRAYFKKRNREYYLKNKQSKAEQL